MKKYVAVSIVLSLFACQKKRSRVNALESNDWFRDGVDRFYLAVGTQNVRQAGSVTGARVGENMLFGLGCFGEPKQPDTVVNVFPDSCNKGPAKMPLNERYKINHFPLAEDPSKPKKGECVVLLGDEQMLAHVQMYPKDYQNGPAADAMGQFAVSAGVCAVSLALLHPWVRSTAGAALQATGTTVGGAFQTKGLFGRLFNQAVTAVPPSKTLTNIANKAQVTLASTTTQVATLTATSRTQIASGVGRFFSTVRNTPALQAGLASLPCFGTGFSMWELMINGKENKNESAFYRGMLEAENLTNKRLASGKYAAAYGKLIAEKRWADAASMKGPLFAYTFNRNVTYNFEQGWKLFGSHPQNFFDTVRKIQADTVQKATEIAEGRGGGTAPGTQNNPAVNQGNPPPAQQ